MNAWPPHYMMILRFMLLCKNSLQDGETADMRCDNQQ